MKKNNYPFIAENNQYTLKSPDGYAFYVVDESTEGTGKGEWTSKLMHHVYIYIYFQTDPVKGVTMNTTDIEKTHHYWHSLLNMNVLSKSETVLKLSYGDKQSFLAFNKIGKFAGAFINSKFN